MPRGIVLSFYKKRVMFEIFFSEFVILKSLEKKDLAVFQTFFFDMLFLRSSVVAFDAAH